TLEGTLELEVEGCGLRLPAGHGVVIGSGAHHALHAPHGARCFIVDTTHAAHVERLAPLAGQVRVADEPVAHLLRYLAASAQLPDAAPELLIDGIAAGALPQALKARRSIDWFALDSWVDNHLARPLSVAALAAQVHLSPTQFAARCLGERGITPMALVRRHRLAAALRLRAAGVGVAAIAERCGYRSPSALTAALRREQRAD
ncbi:MAG: helix-turn-helix domain-containing protein, partial [Rhizobacter sp.]